MLRIQAEALTYDDVSLVPAHSTVLPKDVSLETRLTRDLRLKLPIVSAAMDTVTEARLAIAMAQLGGIGILHKNLTVEQQAAEVAKVKKFEAGVIKEPFTVGPETTIAEVLKLDEEIKELAGQFMDKHHCLFLGRGTHWPVAMEGALKLKEISYIHAEAYAAGELKHGPLALVDKDMPVIAVAPADELLEKLKSNLQEVRARGGELYVFADAGSAIEESEGVHILHMPEHYGMLSPVLHVIPLQLLSYHAALVKGTDVDKPRNLAKSVTVE